MKFLAVVTSIMMLSMTGFAYSGKTSAKKATAHAKKMVKKHKMGEDVSLAEFKKIVASKSATIIDVNSKSSFKKAHIPGSILSLIHI